MGWKEDVLNRIKPTKEESRALDEKISNFLKNVKKVVGDADVVLGGSGAKGTWLKGQHDADVFVLFPEKYKEKSSQLADILEKRLKKMNKRFQRLHGSRDYFRFKEKGFIFEVLPILEIRNACDAVNITDVSPLHAKWLRRKGKMDEIRLAKAFCKAQKCYGAESYIKGFSGYVLEILVIHYGSFEKLLKATLKWEEKQIIDAERLYGKKENVWMVMNKAKLHSPLIVIDPVDKNRNAAAALSKEKWLLFRKKAAGFLKQKSVSFFDKKEIKLEKLKGNVIWIEVESNKGKEDKIGAQLLLAFEFLKKSLDDFGVKKSGWEWDKKAVFWFVVKNKERERVELRKGPPLAMKKHVALFKKKHRKTVVKKKVIWAKLAVKDYRIKDFLKGKVKEKYFKEKVKKVKIV